jgi:hypothetical protein
MKNGRKIADLEPHWKMWIYIEQDDLLLRDSILAERTLFVFPEVTIYTTGAF